MFIVNISGAPTSYTNIQTNYCNLDNPTKNKVRSRDRPSICLTFPTQKKENNPCYLFTYLNKLNQTQYL